MLNLKNKKTFSDEEKALIYKISNSFSVCYKEFEILKQELELLQDPLEINRKMSEIYIFLKTISPIFYNNEQMHSIYYKFNQELNEMMNKIPKSYICDTNIILQQGTLSSKNIKSPEEILNYIVTKAIPQCVKENKVESINELTLENLCKKMSIKVDDICYEMEIQSVKYKIYPAFSESAELLDNTGYHYFNVISINKRKYIVDITYKQFFQLKRNNLDSLGLVGFCGCDPGIYMLMDDERKKIAMELLNKGWIEITKETFKYYLDGFAISYRNGLYYEMIGKAEYQTNYSCINYLDFLRGYDSQYDHEDHEVLGYQHRPLKDSSFEFKLKK